jgi:hypothetical protein
MLLFVGAVIILILAAAIFWRWLMYKIFGSVPPGGKK